MIAIETIAELDANVRRRILELAFREDHEAVLVDSPPGAGKTDLVEMVAALGVDEHLRVLVVAPRNEQVYDFVRRLSSDYDVPITLVHSREVAPPDDVPILRNVTLAVNAAGIPGNASVTVCNVAKAASMVSDLAANDFDLLVCDEAYQVPYRELMMLLHLAPRRLLVGDPGQLKPLVRGDIARYEAAPRKVHWAAPRELLRQHPALPLEQLPATWRFPQDTVAFLQPAFYPQLPFVSGVPDEDRRLQFAAAGMGDPVDPALDLVADGASLVAVVLPSTPRDTATEDPELADLTARVVERLLQRSPLWADGAIAAADLGYVDAHVASGEQVRTRLRRVGIGPEMLTTTPEAWQGLQRPVMIVKHTLSGLSEASGFDLDPGRLSVMTSRHQVAAIIVTRDGVSDTLAEHAHDTEERPVGAVDDQFAGWRSHLELWDRLEAAGRVVRV